MYKNVIYTYSTIERYNFLFSVYEYLKIFAVDITKVGQKRFCFHFFKYRRAYQFKCRRYGMRLHHVAK